ncbi:hypothetical protein KL905_000325 [Ogataea polymorpha]|uniref:Multiple RNA-binding domain-containing protein 1 n=1 Tax=Ogataea polymorpha TaxID=460523 RepID=A0A1B7SIQ4_9ASCO|nr:uncharacterized protein OGAPODRAFT_75918 [Ogataea polymorpha]KAG7882181.1 hypothetical protein KL937_000752 [Ogataea polymorpha]KAG7891735.1 hypothetical protein KL936_001678 [Ogataea polymorpha]KAG7895088.1 hypothetical protein KL908_001438 [Ogataea polymorpha]KAG7902430.1 hypothetical protein KL935_001338 [Ogataea polymorpha]KAG7911582.1 hypothetical protein KL906_000903 [Ogataea polymorpha]
MSRIIVKGLPLYYTEDKLKSHFQKKGVLTDVKLVRNRQGESRRFAFIGYKSQQDAENAVKYFDKTFIDTSRISVQPAKTFSDPTVPIPWREKRLQAKRQLQETEENLRKLEEIQNKRRNKNTKKGVDAFIEDQVSSDPKLQEYLEVSKPSVQQKSWKNEDLVSAQPDDSRDSQLASLATDNASDDEYEEFNGFQSEEEESEKMMTLDEAENRNTQVEPAQDDTKEDSKQSSEIDDLEWFKLRRKRIKEDEVTEEQEKSQDITKANGSHIEEVGQSAQHQSDDQEEPQLSEQEKAIQRISQTGRLFLRNILYSATEDDFRQLFGKYGSLDEVHIAVDTRTGNSKGFAYVKFTSADDAVKAYLELDKQIFQGRLLHILPAEAKKDHTLTDFDLANLPLKKQRELKKKYEASKAQFSWNSLYMNNDAVLESVASKMGISKGELIDPTNSSSAVKQALAEAHVIGDVRKYFEDKGVDLSSFNTKERGDKVILVKNFQHGTTKEEIGELFSAYGQLNRLLMPPAGTIAIVEFRDAPAARAAFSKLAFRRLGKSILYLEKGPKNLFTKEASTEELETVSKTESKADTTEIMDIDNEEDVEISGPTVSVFVKNLNFSTTTNELTATFKSLPGFVVAVVRTRPDPKHTGKTQSMGFGFVEFKTKEQAENAIKIMNGHLLDGHQLQLKLSNRVSQGKSDTVSAKKGKRSPKIIVKNLAFESTRNDIFELFSPFGNLKSVRVPKKFDKSARGFAFVEFSTLKEAESAMDQLQGVHLLGRRLVMDFADAESKDVEEEIERMTKKAKFQTGVRKMAQLRESHSGKRRLDLEDESEM